MTMSGIASISSATMVTFGALSPGTPVAPSPPAAPAPPSEATWPDEACRAQGSKFGCAALGQPFGPPAATRGFTVGV
jgi:hypothetical protein